MPSTRPMLPRLTVRPVVGQFDIMLKNILLSERRDHSGGLFDPTN